MKKLLTLLALALGAGAQAQTWTGATNADWFTASNWNPAAVPASTASVTIPGGLATYPTLTAAVTVGELNMTTGSALHLAGFAFTDNGNVSIQAGTVDGGGTLSIVSAGNVDIRNSTIVATTNILGSTSASQLFGNTITGNTTISDAATNINATNYTDGNLFTGNLTITHAGTAEMDLGYGAAGAGDHVTGSCAITLSGPGSFFLGYNEDFRVDGNLTVTRTASGFTSLFRGLSTGQSQGNAGIGGNLSYTNNVGGDCYINSDGSINLTIGGTVNISAAATGYFHMSRVTNNAAGGSISVANASDVNLQLNNLKATLSITSYTSALQMFNNSVNGNTTLTDAPTLASNVNYFDGNLFNGDLNITHSGTAEMDQGFGAAGPGDHVTGNCSITLSGSGPFFVGYNEDFKVDGNLSVIRTVAGNTNFFRGLGTGQSQGNAGIGGNFMYTNNTGGDFAFNTNNSMLLPVGGTVQINSSAAGNFFMYRLRNAAAGGNVTVTNANSIDLRNDTLKAALALTAYSGTMQLFNSGITGNTTIADAPSQASNVNYFDGNLFNGDLNITHSGIAEMDQGYGASGPGDHVTGNCNITLSGSGPFYVSYSEDFKVDGNLSVTRTAAGYTNLFRDLGGGSSSGNSSIGGAFTYTNNAGGDFLMNNSNRNTLPIGGAITVNSSSPNVFHLYRTATSAAGGGISIANSSELLLLNDTLNSPINITSYTSTFELFDNAFNAAVSVADAPTQANGTNYIDGNLFGNRFTLVHQSPGASLYDGYGSPSGNGNVVKGRDSIVNVAGAATLYLSYNHPHRADSAMVLNGSATMSIPSLSFGGSGNGFLRNDGQAPLAVPILNIQKTGGSSLTLQLPLTITNTINFTSGYIRDSSIAPLTFANGAGYSGAGDGSHIIGPVIKQGNQAFTFPLGNGAYYSPAGISAPQNSTDAFTAQFFPYQPGIAGYDSSLHDASINHISRAAFWTIDRTAGSSNVQVTLGYNRPASGAVTAMNELTVAHWYDNGTSLGWHDEGNGGTTGTNILGTITSANTISSFSPFTLASTTVANPLPVKISAFDAARLGETSVLTWTAAAEQDIAGYSIQRSTNGSSWTTLATVPAKAGGAPGQQYHYTDAKPAAGRNYYRLDIGGQDGGSTFSEIRTLNFGDGADGAVQVYPNPVDGLVHVSGNPARVRIFDLNGRLLLEGAADLDMSNMPAGAYLLEATSTEGIKTATTIRKK